MGYCGISGMVQKAPAQSSVIMAVTKFMINGWFCRLYLGCNISMMSSYYMTLKHNNELSLSFTEIFWDVEVGNSRVL